MKKILITLFAILSTNTFAGSAQNIADAFNASSTPAELVKSGWAGNDAGKGYKVLQVIVKDSSKAAELHIDANGKVVAAFDNAKTSKLDSNVDYKMIASMEDWASMGTGESGPMYHRLVF